MNTRVQVEHTVTEEITDVDIVRLQVEVALFNELNISQEDITINGFAIETRINAEDPEKNFQPVPGQIEMLHFSLGRYVRVDTAVYPGYKIPPNYDSMIAKVIVRGKDRLEAINKMTLVLDETVIGPLNTNLDFQYYLMQHPNYIPNIVDITFLQRNRMIEDWEDRQVRRRSERRFSGKFRYFHDCRR